MYNRSDFLLYLSPLVKVSCISEKQKKIHFSLVFRSICTTFAAVNVRRKRNMASWLLLAVFVPMLLLSSLHIHNSSVLAEESCSECVQHNCHGHLGELTTTMHACVLCQFLTMSFVAAAVFAVVLYNKVCKTQMAQRQCDVHLDVCGIPTLRAPPFV